MNIRTLTVTSEEDKYGVKYKLVPEWKSLGVAFKKDVSKIRAELPKIADTEIKDFIKTKKITVAGFELTEEHLQITRFFDDSHSSYQASFTSDVLVIVDTALDQDLVKEGNAREIVNRVQRLRKKADLSPTDDILYYIHLTSDPKDELKDVIVELKDVLNKYLKQDIALIQEKQNFEQLIVEEEQEVWHILFSVEYFCILLYAAEICSLSCFWDRFLIPSLTFTSSRKSEDLPTRRCVPIIQNKTMRILLRILLFFAFLSTGLPFMWSLGSGTRGGQRVPDRSDENKNRSNPVIECEHVFEESD